jgi:hypothetical protein
MADLGAITSNTNSDVSRVYAFYPGFNGPTDVPSVFRRKVPNWIGGYVLDILQTPHTGTITGTVTETIDSVEFPVKRWVRLHHRHSGTLIAAMYSDENTGQFSFDGLNPSDLYYVIALDNLADANTYNALIFDNLTPV